MSEHKHGKGNGKRLRKAREKLSMRRNAHAKTLSSVKDPAAYRAPGSMKGRS